MATLALGIGANTAIFSVVDGVLLKPPRFPASERLVQIAFGYPIGALCTYRSVARSWEAVATYEYGGELNLFADGVAERVKERPVSAAAGEGARLPAGGVAAGLLAAWLGASLLRGFIFGIGVRDPVSFLAVPLVFAGVGLAAGCLPARRATRVSPAEVMREE